MSYSHLFSIQSPSSTSLRLLRMCVCLCGGSARREAKRVLAGENDAMLAVPASAHAPANEAPANDFESRVEHLEMVCTAAQAIASQHCTMCTIHIHSTGDL